MDQPSPAFEIERKRAFKGSIAALIESLKRHKFYEYSKLQEVDTYYSRPDIDFMKTVECLRIRERDEFAEITYKPASTDKTQTRDGVTIKPETNLPINASDVVIAKQLLENIGMIKLVEINKLRHTYISDRNPSIAVSIDKIKGAGTFIETEITSTNKSLALKQIDEIEQILNISDLTVVTRPYRDICMDERN